MFILALILLLLLVGLRRITINYYFPGRLEYEPTPHLNDPIPFLFKAAATRLNIYFTTIRLIEEKILDLRERMK